MADEKSEWGEPGQPSEGGIVRDERRPPRPAGQPSIDRESPDIPQGEAPPPPRNELPRPAI
jgi:hypothetical protein